MMEMPAIAKNKTTILIGIFFIFVDMKAKSVYYGENKKH